MVHRAVCSLVICGGMLFVGCEGKHPRASISDPQVFTIADVQKAEREFAGGKASIDQALTRNFLEATTQPRLIGDTALDNSQRNSALLSQVALLTKIRLEYQIQAAAATQPSQKSTAEPAGGAASPSDKASGIQTAIDSFLTEAKQGSVGDSPFDRLDRINDFYTAMMLKHLRAQAQSFQLPAAGKIENAFSGSYAPPLGENRVLLLSMQAHVDPGNTGANYAGVIVQVLAVLDEHGRPIITEPMRNQILTLKNSSGWGQRRVLFDDYIKSTGTINAEQRELLEKCSKNSIQLLHVHPTHSYDLDETNYLESLKSVAEVAAALTAGQGSGAVSRNSSSESDMRRQFISRITKQASYVSANQKLFGWNFYPSNLQVNRRGLLRMGLGAIFGDMGTYDVDATLEGGARDCAVFIGVPENARYLKLQVGYVYATVGGSEIAQPKIIGDILCGNVKFPENKELLGNDSEVLFVPLPDGKKDK